MDFEWDEAKRLRNIEKHGLDFIDAQDLFADGAKRLEKSGRTVSGEHRVMAIGCFGERHVALIYTLRTDAIRMISLRPAREGERNEYRKTFGGGTEEEEGSR